MSTINIKQDPQAIRTLDHGDEIEIDGYQYLVGRAPVGGEREQGIYFYEQGPSADGEDDRYLRLKAGHKYALASKTEWINAVVAGDYTHDRSTPPFGGR